MGKKVDFSTVIVFKEEDDIHDWILYDYSRRKGLVKRVIDVKDIKNHRLSYTSILDKKELLLITGDDVDIAGNMSLIKKINRKRRLLAISCYKKSLLKTIEETFGKYKVRKVPSTRKYEERLKIVDKIIKLKGLKFRNEEVKKSLRKNMVRSTKEWEDMFLLWEVYKYRDELLEQEDIDEIFEDTDFYNLDTFIFKVLKGETKKKTHKIASYFLDTKGYSKRWLLGKIREEYINLGMFYQAYRGGVLIMPEGQKMLFDRVVGIGWNEGLRIADFQKYKQDRYLKFVKEVSYKFFLDISDVLYKEDVDIYSLIEEIKQVRRGH